MRYIRSRDQKLGQRNRIIRQEQERQEALDVGIGVDHFADVDDETNGEFGHIIAWCGLSGEENHARDDGLAFCGGHAFDGEVSLGTCPSDSFDGVS